jgi:hypothetical protein
MTTDYEQAEARVAETVNLPVVTMPTTVCPTRYKLTCGTQRCVPGLTLGVARRHQPRRPRRRSRFGLRAAPIWPDGSCDPDPGAQAVPGDHQ